MVYNVVHRRQLSNILTAAVGYSSYKLIRQKKKQPTGCHVTKKLGRANSAKPLNLEANPSYGEDLRVWFSSR